MAPTVTRDQAVDLLRLTGWSPYRPDYGFSFLGDAFADDLRHYQSYHGLPSTGELDDATAEHLAKPRCALPDVLAIAAESSWAEHSLRYYQSIIYPGVDRSEIAADYDEAWRRMTAVCGLTAFWTALPARAQVVATSDTIDGPWNILALSELPPPDAPASFVAHQTFDLAETGLTREQRVACMAHEIGHALGLGHATPGSGNLMEPVLSAIDHPQAGDTQQLVERYGLPATNPITPPSPAPPLSPGAGPVPPIPASFELDLPDGGKLALTILYTPAAAAR